MYPYYPTEVYKYRRQFRQPPAFGKSLLEPMVKRWMRTHPLGKHFPHRVNVEARNYNWRTDWWQITEDDIKLMEGRYDS